MRPVRMLLVDDNPADVELTRDTLEAGKLHVQVEVCTDGEAALKYLLAALESGGGLPDLMLLDLNMPRMDGRSLLGAMRAKPELQALPVVILSSSDAEQDIVKSYELGANCYVTKPVGLQAFQDIVRSVEAFWFTVVRLP